jgi:hypothetical protein
MKNNKMKTAELTVENQELNKVVDNSGLQLTEAETIKQIYLPYFQQIAEVKERAKAINWDNPGIEDEKLCRELRLFTVKIRTFSEAVKDERKKIHMLRANVEQSAWNLIKTTCQLEEETFLQVEKKRAIQEEQRIERIRIDRLALLAPHVQNPDIFPVESMSEEAFTNLLEGQILANNARREADREADRKANEERVAREKKEAEEREAQRIENERLKAEAAERERLMQEERDKAEAEKKAMEEAAEKERKANEAKLKKEREANEKLQAEIKAKAEAEAKVKRDQEAKEAAELKAKQDAERKAKAAPDKAKLLEWANLIDLLQLPDVKSDEANKVVDQAKGLLLKVSAFIRENSGKL